MSAGGNRIGARLIAGLDDASSIERRPIEEVRAALLQTGLDPAPSIALARRLASGDTAGSAAGLLRKIEAADAVDAEIEDLEQAPIDQVRATLRSATGPTVTGRERSSAHGDAQPSKRRRLRALGWGGSLIGIAASVLLFAAVRPDVLERQERIEAGTAAVRSPPTAGEDEASMAEEAGERRESDVAQMVMPSESEPRPDGATARNRQQAAVAKRTAGAPSAALEVRPPAALLPEEPLMELGLAADADPPPARVSHRPAPKPTPNARELAALADEDDGKLLPSAERAAPTVFMSRAEELPFGLDEVRGVFVVDEERAPRTLRALETAKPDPGLAARADEAAHLEPDGTILALVALDRGGRRIEAALVGMSQAEPVRTQPLVLDSGIHAFVEAAPATLSEPAPAYELLELPDADRSQRP